MSKVKNKQQTPEPDLKKKFTILAVLCALVGLVLVYQYWVTSAIPVPVATTDTAQAGKPKDKRIPWDQANQSNNDGGQAQQNPQAPQNGAAGLLDTDGLLRKTGAVDIGRNPFEYPPPPPPTPPPPQPPPTIQVTSISPNSVYARTAPFEVVVNGSNFSLDMRLYLNGNPNFAQTVLVSDKQIKATVPQSYFASQGVLRFDIKKPGQEQAFFSNVLQISILEPQNPNTLFKMIGHFTDRDGNPCAVLSENDTKPTSVAKVSDVIFGNWKVISISKTTMELEDVKQALGVRWPIKMKDDFAGTGVASVSPANNAYQATAYTQTQQQYDEVASPANDPNVIDLDQAMSNAGSNSKQILGQSAEDAKKQQEQFKQMNQTFIQQRQEMLKQRQQLIQQQGGIIPNPR